MAAHSPLAGAVIAFARHDQRAACSSRKWFLACAGIEHERGNAADVLECVEPRGTKCEPEPGARPVGERDARGSAKHVAGRGPEGHAVDPEGSPGLEFGCTTDGAGACSNERDEQAAASVHLGRPILPHSRAGCTGFVRRVSREADAATRRDGSTGRYEPVRDDEIGLHRRQTIGSTQGERGGTGRSPGRLAKARGCAGPAEHAAVRHRPELHRVVVRRGAVSCGGQNVHVVPCASQLQGVGANEVAGRIAGAAGVGRGQDRDPHGARGVEPMAGMRNALGAALQLFAVVVPSCTVGPC